LTGPRFLDACWPSLERRISALQDSADQGSLVLSDIAYAEICAHFEKQRECDQFLDASDIRVQALTREAHFLASRAWRSYRQQGGERTRILADFMIGAHAQIHATRLLSRDRGFYQTMFRSLEIIDPTRAGRP
jgi:predicted nucleic acid-binding protein